MQEPSIQVLYLENVLHRGRLPAAACQTSAVIRDDVSLFFCGWGKDLQMRPGHLPEQLNSASFPSASGSSVENVEVEGRRVWTWTLLNSEFSRHRSPTLKHFLLQIQNWKTSTTLQRVQLQSPTDTTLHVHLHTTQTSELLTGTWTHRVFISHIPTAEPSASCLIQSVHAGLEVVLHLETIMSFLRSPDFSQQLALTMSNVVLDFKGHLWWSVTFSDQTQTDV